MGKLLRVNLDSKDIRAESLNEEVLKKFVGGVGLAAKIIYD
ncbi:MAG: aldehyde ferredoxin oxidoreductase N-terminal domain-containing protein, partial [Candidatus Bathyarchaeia archaeon]